MVQEKYQEILSCNLKQTEMQTHLDKAESDLLKHEASVAEAKAVMSEQAILYRRIKM